MSVTISLTVTEEAEAKIRQKVESGLYHSDAEVIEEALRLLDEHDRLRWLRAAIADGDQGEDIAYTPELRAEMWDTALRGAEAGEKPDPDVLPPDAIR